jgi:hypothetical protein
MKYSYQMYRVDPDTSLLKSGQVEQQQYLKQ